MANADASLPTAEIRPTRRISLAWVVPLLAVIFAGWLVYRAWTLRGVRIVVRLDDGHGLRAGDEVRHLGTAVGTVREVRLAHGQPGVEVVANLQPAAGHLAARGSRFWVVRPELGLDRVTGLDTLVGPRYLAVRPGGGPPLREFEGLAAPPIVGEVQPGDLEIILESAERRGLRAGSPVLYRDVQIGTVLSVALSSDGGSVESRLHLDGRFADLIRPDTVFWPVGGIEADLGLSGFSLELQSLQTLLVGGVALATPPGGGEAARTGHRFTLSDDAPDGWRRWQPMAVIGSAMLPAGAALPHPLRATIGWRRGWILRGQRSRQGWVLPTAGGLLGPANLLQADEGAREGSAMLEVAGTAVSLDGGPSWQGRGLALREGGVDAAAWPTSRMRVPEAPEDALVVTDSASAAPIAAARMTAVDGRWLVDPAVPIEPGWHGAAVVSRDDGAVIGILVMSDDDEPAEIVPLFDEAVTKCAVEDAGARGG